MCINKIKNLFCKNKKIKYNQFFDQKIDYAKLEDIIFLTKSTVIGDYDVEKKIYKVSTLKKATENDISFLTNKKYVEDLKNTKAGAVFVEKSMVDRVPTGTVALIHENPHFAYMLCLQAIYKAPIFEINAGLSRKSHIAWSAKIGKNVEIQDGAYIDKNVVIGNNCKICANAVIYHDCVIGDNSYIGANSTIMYTNIGKDCIIHNGAQIGQCGFGFVHNKMFNFKIPQIGKVIIGDYVEIGANSCIDRGALDDTIIEANVKIDNIVQIGHGAKIGAGSFIAGGVGIAGSTEIGKFVQLGGKVGVAGHIKIADGVQIAGNSGVAQGIEKPMSSWGGYPAMPIRRWHKQTILLEKMINKKGETENE
ncbi:MAG: UDP-3-O-(3-hydroxymyristoyl)glucosamine N-acyltransferase [Rickettsiales bacterium]|nr:UDP-3-O-(3-hydroxymyristoyl)glucosamine N-acyltransferase [Rickettsiales bacterium]